MSEYYTVKQLAKLAGVTQQRIRQEIKNGNIKNATKIGRDWVIPVNDAANWLSARFGGSALKL